MNIYLCPWRQCYVIKSFSILLYTHMILVGIDQKFWHIEKLRYQLLHIACISQAVSICPFNAMKQAICMIKLPALSKHKYEQDQPS